tara:strand:+ start:387 stop:818 length:432 start_codon:yes stop_codon:yes gene_type:complete
MRDILIILLAVLFTILTIVLFKIKSISQQFLILVFVLLAFLIFYMAVDKLHIFKDSENEVNFNNTTFSSEGEILEEESENSEDHDMELNHSENDGQNLVEAPEESNNYNNLTMNDLINPNYSIQNANTNNFGNVNNKFVGDLM